MLESCDRCRKVQDEVYAETDREFLVMMRGRMVYAVDNDDHPGPAAMRLKRLWEIAMARTAPVSVVDCVELAAVRCIVLE